MVSFRNGGRRQQRQRDIGESACDDGYEHDHERLARGEPKFLRRLRNGFKSGERPWRENDDVHRRAERRLPRRERRRETENIQSLPRQREDECRRHSQYENQRRGDLDADRQTPSMPARRSRQKERNDDQHHFRQINIVFGYLIEMAFFKYSVQKISGDQRDGRGVRPDDREIDKNQKPRAEHTVVKTHLIFGV